MKVFKSSALKTALAIAVSCYAAHSFAAGTLAGTTVNNKATLSFTVGAAAQPVVESSPTGNSLVGINNGANTAFLVDRKVNMSVVESGASSNLTVPGATQVVTLFKVSNLGNSVQDFLLTAEALATGVTLATASGDSYGTGASNFAVSNCTTAVSPAQLASVTTVPTSFSTLTYLDELAPDSAQYVQVKCDMPAVNLAATTSPPGFNTGDLAAVRLVATVAASACATLPASTCATVGTAGTALVATTTPDDAAVVDTVFGDPAGPTGLSTDLVSDGKASARDTYKITAAQPKVTKTSAVVCDPINGLSGPKRIPGSIIKYSITVLNEVRSGQTVADVANLTLTKLEDLIDSNLDFVSDAYVASVPAACTATSVNTGATLSLNSACASGAAVSPARTSTTCPAAAANALFASSTLTVDFAGNTTMVPALTGTNPAAVRELRPTDSITVDFYARVK